MAARASDSVSTRKIIIHWFLGVQKRVAWTGEKYLHFSPTSLFVDGSHAGSLVPLFGLFGKVQS
jgi:hypothetical protein